MKAVFFDKINRIEEGMVFERIRIGNLWWADGDPEQRGKAKKRD